MNEAGEPEAITVEIRVVGKSGRMSLGKRFAGQTVRIERRADGTVLLIAVTSIPKSQRWTIEEPHRSRIARGLDWAARTEPRETDPGTLRALARARYSAADG